MSKFDLGRKFAAIVCTAIFSSVFVLGAVGPAEAIASNPAAIHRVA